MLIRLSRWGSLGVALAAGSIITLSLSTAHAAPASLSTPYSQNFNALASSGTTASWTDDVTIPGWYTTPLRTQYSVSTGTANGGALYGFGAANDSDRALGSICSGSLQSLAYGVRLVNDTANTISSVSISYSGEQWREGGSSSSTLSVQQKLDFAWRVTAANATTGSFTDADGLDFSGPHFGSVSGGALDGNTNSVTVTGSLAGLNLAPGQWLWLQWSDTNDLNNDHALAIDNLTVTVTGTGGGGGPGEDDCAEADSSIGAAQGSGSASPIPGSSVTVQGVVVGDYEGAAPALRGFYVQDSGDGDAATSDAIFVFNGNNDAVNVGDLVQVTGTVTEFQDLTEIGTVTKLEVCGHNQSVAPTPVALPVPNADFLERYEGMLVGLPQTLTVTELYQLGRFGQVVVAAGGKLPQPTNIVEPGAPALAQQAINRLARIILDDGDNSENPDPIVFGRNGQPLSASNTLRGGDTVTGVTGVMTYTWAGNSASGNAWRVRPVHALGASLPNFVAANPRPTAAPEVGGRLKIASFNLLNYFNTFSGCTFGVGGAAADCRGADNATEYERQAAKTVQAIQALNADVVGVIEIENDGYAASSAIADLVARVNAVMGANTYKFVDFDAQTGLVNAGGTDAIKVGILYKPGSVTPVPGATFADADPIHNRKPLAQAFADMSHQRFSVIINHFKSKGCDGASGSDLDQGGGQGCFNARRNAQASRLLSFIETVQAGAGDQDVFVLGDLNAYAKEDPIDTLLAGGLTNLTLQFGGAAAYGYVFDGQWGYLDQALATQSAASQVTGQADFHINSDEPSQLDYNTNYKSPAQVASLYAPDMYRTSDHDPVLIGVTLSAPAPVPASSPWLKAVLAAWLAAAGALAWRRARQS